MRQKWEEHRGRWPRKPNYDRHAPARSPVPLLLLICGHFWRDSKRSFEARRRAVNGSRYWDRLQKYSGVFRFVHLRVAIWSGDGCETSLRSPPSQRHARRSCGFVQLGFGTLRADGDRCARPLMHVDWLRFGRRSILGSSKRSRHKIYGLMTDGRTICTL